jgi:hypothetical protein
MVRGPQAVPRWPADKNKPFGPEKMRLAAPSRITDKT